MGGRVVERSSGRAAVRSCGRVGEWPALAHLPLITSVDEVTKQRAVHVGKGECVAEGEGKAHIGRSTRDEEAVGQRMQTPHITLRGGRGAD